MHTVNDLIYNNYFSFRSRYNELVQFSFLKSLFTSANLVLRLLVIALYYRTPHRARKGSVVLAHGALSCGVLMGSGAVAQV